MLIRTASDAADPTWLRISPGVGKQKGFAQLSTVHAEPLDIVPLFHQLIVNMV